MYLNFCTKTRKQWSGAPDQSSVPPSEPISFDDILSSHRPRAAAADGRPHIHFLPGYCRTMEAERGRGEILANLATHSTCSKQC